MKRGNRNVKGNKIFLTLDTRIRALGREGYRLDCSEDGLRIAAQDKAGLFYGIQTLRQMLPVQNYSDRAEKRLRVEVPMVFIEDIPRFSWRGSHLDVSRHFMPKEFIKKYIDLLAMHKLNTFHWHLTDDQGWRIEIKRYPKLTSVGAWRKSTPVGHEGERKDSNKPHGGFYTQEDIKEIVAYAKARYVNVVPEIEMPGHAQAAIAAYPELGNTDKKLEVATRWGVIEDVFNPEDSTIKFLQNVLDEVLELFPSQFIHIGGDEVPKTQWKKNPRAQQKIKKLGLKDEHELQSWFIRQMDEYLTKKGRRLIGWDEILEGGLAPGATVMSWRGEAGGIEAAKAGHDVVMASTNALYFDYYQAPRQNEPLAIGGFLPLKRVYDYDMVPAALTADQAKRILGGQFQIWTEYIPTPLQAEYMAFPRGCAAAEILWSPKRGKNYANFLTRLQGHLARLEAMNVNFRKLDPESGEPHGTWKSGGVSNDYQEKQWDVSKVISKPGKYAIRFQYTGGAHRLDVNGVEIVVNGSVIARDTHFGRTGGEDKDNIWRVTIPALAPGAQVSLRAKVRADGGSDSNGEIWVTAE